jgi:hypothetical protein
MGGGRIKKALRRIRNKRTRRARRKPGTRRLKHTQTGGRNHYLLDEIKDTKNSALITVTLNSKPVPTSKRNQINNGSLDVLPTYLREVSKIWARKVNTPFFVSQAKANIPNSDNIGCFSGFEKVYRVDKLVRYAPDRLCCVLGKETEQIILLPAIHGNIDTFLRVKTAINEITVNLEKIVYIFSPPFFGEDIAINKVLFLEFLNYKNTSKAKFYILMDYSVKTIEAAKLVSKDIAVDFANNKDDIENLKKELTRGKKEVGPELITALHPMLEPNYIIYPYTIQFPIVSMATTVGNIGKLTSEEYTKQLERIEATVSTAEKKLNDVTTRVSDAEKNFNRATQDVWSVMNSHSTTAGALAKAKKALEEKEAEINTNNLKISALGDGMAKSNLQAEQALLNTQQTRLNAEFEEAKRKDESTSTNYIKQQTKARDTQAVLNALKKELTSASQSLKSITTKADRAKTALKMKMPIEGDKTENSVQEKGGILFSAAKKDEPILPAAYSGFDSAAKYVQTNDSNTARGSIAYRVDLSQKDPLLDGMDYKEYNLLLAPPMNEQSILTFKLTKKLDTTVLTIDDTQEAFIANPNASHTHVPGIPVTVGTKDFTLRSPVPDVVAEWNNGIYTEDEVYYLNSMEMSPKILRAIFGNSWKTQLTDHLSAISRSKCFKDPRLLLHADCQEAQAFVAQILKYYMEHSSDIIKVAQQQRDANISSLQRALDAQAKAFAMNNKVSDESIFDVAPFIKTFFPGTGDRYLTSVGQIKVIRTLAEFTLTYSYEDRLQAPEKQKIEKVLNATPLTITVITEPKPSVDGVYKWSFPNAVNEYELTTAAHKYITSLIITDTPYGTESSSTITVVYFGKLSQEDEQLIKETIKYTETSSAGNLHTWNLDPHMSETEVKEALDKIANTNIHNITLTQRASVDYNEITENGGSINFSDNTIVKTFLARVAANPSNDIMGELSISLNSGLSIEDCNKVLDEQFKIISQKVNMLPREQAAFNGKYAFSVS